MGKFKDSELAHKYLDGLKGIEIGGAAHNPFNLQTVNVDVNGDMNTVYKNAERKQCDEAMKVDIVAPGDKLPFKDKSFDFVISSHVLEHFFDPIQALIEWNRVSTKYIFLIVPNKDLIEDYKDLELTTIKELEQRHTGEIEIPEGPTDKHWSVWNAESFGEFIEQSMGFEIIEMLEIDDKVGNGFCFVLKAEDIEPVTDELTDEQKAFTNASVLFHESLEKEDLTAMKKHLEVMEKTAFNAEVMHGVKALKILTRLADNATPKELPSDNVILEIAKACHETNRAYCKSIGDDSQVEWEKAEQWQKESAIKDVKVQLQFPLSTPQDMHESWLNEKKETGWKFGKEKDEKKKTHPCMVPYEDLSFEQKVKDALFIAVVRSLAG